MPSENALSCQGTDTVFFGPNEWIGSRRLSCRACLCLYEFLTAQNLHSQFPNLDSGIRCCFWY
uniref:Rpl5, OrsajM_p49 n=1 Tax=Arundo donax TaxID=35708 RepID=A0A0A9DI25_ARUDO